MATRKSGKRSSPPARKRARTAPAAPPAAPPAETAEDPVRLQELRKKIDALDDRLIRILNERASLVVEVGKTKRTQGIPIYAPHREAEVLRKVLAANKGPLPDRTIEGIYREMMSGSFALEQPLRIGYLGPPGSHSHAAAVKQFGASVDYEDLHEIGGVFTEVRRGHVNYGLVPIENSLGGGIVETLDAFKANAHQISIYGEVQITIHHALLANCQPRQVRRIHSKPEIFQQCRNWLSTQYPGVELMPAASSSRAAQIAVEECRKALEIGAEPGAAAIGTTLAGQLYGLNVLFARIEDDPNNVTRFVIIARQNARPTGDDKTSIMFTTDDAPGALVSVLGVFQAAGINLSHIDKRPRGRGENWTYMFFIDALGHRDEPNMAATIERARAHCRELLVLGSYPRSRRIL
ncbi:chorismate mutase [Archangium sp.]|jgi:chorismate mutase/prephenate dehydratase|uniref:chorismate mutase n=1 Tax=Archangium sp. TaxID=1872627 RepID=UPI002ED83F1B